MHRYVEFGRLLRQARLAKALRQEDVARAIEISTEYYARIERGHVLGALDTFAALRAYLAFDANPVIAALGCRSKPVPQRRRAPIPRAVQQGPHSGAGQILRHARMQREWTQTGVATAIGCTLHHYGLVEAGLKLPSVKAFGKLQHCLGFDANELLDALLGEPTPFAAFGELLGNARTRKDRTMAEVAGAVGCEVGQYRRIEAGAALPTIAMVARLHRVLGFGLERALRAIPVDPALDSGDASGFHHAVGRLLQQSRLQRAMLHADVARSAGMAARTYARLEAGFHLPSVETLARLHDCLGFDANQLLRAVCRPSRPFLAFGRLLTWAREHLDRTPAEVAETARCSLTQYERFEEGVALPSAMAFVRLHRVLGFDAAKALRAIPVEPTDEAETR
jgi:transcriptional regulator with XRE-family HTH domain